MKEKESRRNKKKTLFKTLKLLTRLLPSPPFHRASPKTRIIPDMLVTFNSHRKNENKKYKNILLFPFFSFLGTAWNNVKLRQKNILYTQRMWRKIQIMWRRKSKKNMFCIQIEDMKAREKETDVKRTETIY